MYSKSLGEGFNLSSFEVEEEISKLNSLFVAMKIKAQCVGIEQGLRTRNYQVKLSLGEKVSKIRAIHQEIALVLKSLNEPQISLETRSGLIQITTTFNDEPILIPFEEVVNNINLDSYKLPLLIGLEMNKNPKIIDLADSPHILVAGTTGSGKSVLMKSMIETLKHKHTDTNLQLCIIDPKLTDFKKHENTSYVAAYKNNYEESLELLETLCILMDKRYKSMNSLNTNDFETYQKESNEPWIVVVIDELADLILQDKGDQLQNFLIRLLQKSRAAGIHVIISTQRPSREVVSGLIKANTPVQIALKCSTSYDSRTILNEQGAESLIGKGDLLVKYDGKLTRVQATFLQ